MATNNLMTQGQTPSATRKTTKSWQPLLLALVAATLLLASIKIVGVLLPYINRQLF